VRGNILGCALARFGVGGLSHTPRGPVHRASDVPCDAGETPTGGLARARARDDAVAMAEIDGVEFWQARMMRRTISFVYHDGTNKHRNLDA
jgi:hypothetical protein